MCQTTPSCVCSPTNELQRRYSNVFRKCSPECGSMPDTSNDGLIDPLSRIGFRPARPSSDAYFSRDSKYTQWEILLQACLARRGTNLADVQQQERKAKSCCGNQKKLRCTCHKEVWTRKFKRCSAVVEEDHSVIITLAKVNRTPACSPKIGTPRISSSFWLCVEKRLETLRRLLCEELKEEFQEGPNFSVGSGAGAQKKRPDRLVNF